MRLTNLSLREHFLVKLFTLARFRQIARQPEMSRPVAFHAGHKLLLLAYNQEPLPPGRADRPTTNGCPRPRCSRATARNWPHPARTAAHPGGDQHLHHAFGWISEHLGPEEKRYLLDTIEEYRDERAACRRSPGCSGTPSASARPTCRARCSSAVPARPGRPV